MKIKKLLVLAVLSISSLMSSLVLAKTCEVSYDNPKGGKGTYNYIADNEWQAQAKFIKDHPGYIILDIRCK